ncbi:hypothetical protein G6F43_005042 [Rhizopus delemar]|nr:hypothetical protein G6F43_005042 [Rhizopus delemar]
MECSQISPRNFDNKVTDISQLNLEADESEMIVCYATIITSNEETAEGNIDETEENDNTEQDEQRVDIVERKKQLREAYETILMYKFPLDDLDCKLHRRIRMRLAELNKSRGAATVLVSLISSKAIVVDNFNQWRNGKNAKVFWEQREEVNQVSIDDSISQQNDNNSSLAATTKVESIEMISLADAKAIMIENIIPIDDNSNDLSFSNSLSNFKRDVNNSLDVSLLTYETHLQHLLRYPIKTIRKIMYDSFGFNESNHKFPLDSMMAIITIVNDINCGLLTRLSAESKILAIINDITDTVVIRLLLCIKSMVEISPMVNQKKEIKEFELCTRFLQTAFQKLFDYDDDELIFKWSNANCFDDTNNDSNQNRPDGIVENDKKAVVYFEVEPITCGKNHRKVNIDFHRLCVFSKTGSAVKAKHMLQIMAVGTNIQLHLSQVRGDVLIVVELDSIRLPLSLDELPQMIPYLDHLYNVVGTIYRCCYENNTADVLSEFGYYLEPK